MTTRTTKRIERLMIAIMFALFAAGITLVVASAEDNDPEPAAHEEEGEHHHQPSPRFDVKLT